MAERLHIQILDESMSPDLLPFDVCIVDCQLDTAGAPVYAGMKLAPTATVAEYNLISSHRTQTIRHIESG